MAPNDVSDQVTSTILDSRLQLFGAFRDLAKSVAEFERSQASLVDSDNLLNELKALAQSAHTATSVRAATQLDIVQTSAAFDSVATTVFESEVKPLDEKREVLKSHIKNASDFLELATRAQEGLGTLKTNLDAWAQKPSGAGESARTKNLNDAAEKVKETRQKLDKDWWRMFNDDETPINFPLICVYMRWRYEDEIKAWKDAKSTKTTVDKTMEEFQTARKTVANQATTDVDLIRPNLQRLIEMWKTVRTLVEDLHVRLKALDLVMNSPSNTMTKTSDIRKICATISQHLHGMKVGTDDSVEDLDVSGELESAMTSLLEKLLLQKGRFMVTLPIEVPV